MKSNILYNQQSNPDNWSNSDLITYLVGASIIDSKDNLELWPDDRERLLELVKQDQDKWS
jgi:hypothetical protein